MNIIQRLCKEFNLQEYQVKNTLEMIDEGNTIPFIARYRKEKTGSLDDVVLRDLDERLAYLRNLETRKNEVIRLIDEQEKLTDELREEILSSEVLQRVEDLYRPYKQKKKTRATMAKAKGLEPLATIIINQKMESGNLEEIASPYLNDEVETINDAYQGAMDIIAETVSDNADFREKIRELYLNNGIIHTEATDDSESSVFEMYYKFQEELSKIANHRILAINRGENEKKLKVTVASPDDQVVAYLKRSVIKNDKAITTGYLNDAIEDSYKRLIVPSVTREVRNILTERAEEEAIKVFGQNTKNLLLVPPTKNARVLAIDPSFRTGCKLTALDDTGKLLEYTTIYPNEPQNEVVKSKKIIKELVAKYDLNLISIGNGTASRETEMLIAEIIKEMDKEVSYTIVSEAGASVYSASKIAHEEYPDIDVSIRGAISIGRRLQDPLAELVKIDPKSIGVGQYQHDVNQPKLAKALDGVVEDCVNSVGVDLNTASFSLLQHIAGVNKTVAKNIVKHREENGKFHSRDELKTVSRLGDKVYEQCAGFLRISEGENYLDKTAVHPESYETANRLIEKLGYDFENLKELKFNDINQRILKIEIKEKKQNLEIKGDRVVKSLQDLGKLQINQKKKSTKELYDERIEWLAAELSVGIPTLTDIIEELKRPGRDPRDEMHKPIFRSDVLKIEDLRPGMMVTGTVRNVVDFGAFVDIGVKQDGLIHISQLSDKYIKSAMSEVQVGDTVTARIIDIDAKRSRISLSLKKEK
ncbi:MAG: RNA-binding transcriptional accessory protein [Dethiosulfatibacter sp.]|nr:RNA-binding transcriptional accessory protein [Dethiosulfatibacter sp.]